jgi:hypothetical protein
MIVCRQASAKGTDFYLLGLVLVCLVQVVFYSRHLIVSDFVSQYPFMGGDSQDWIANGLRLAGFDVRYSVRPPLLPLVISVLERIGLLNVLPVLLLVLSQLVAFPLYIWLASRCGKPVAIVMSIALMTNFQWLGLGLEVMADVPAASLLFMGSWCFVKAAEDRPRWYLVGGLLIGLCAITQQIALLFPLPAACALLVHRRGHFTEPLLYVGALIGTIPFAVWTIYKFFAFGTLGDVLMPQWGLVQFHLHSLDRYALTATSMLGIPLTVSTLIGFASLIARARYRLDDFFVAGIMVAVVFFVVLLYEHHAKRLLIYIVPFVMIVSAETFRLIGNRMVRSMVAALLLITSMMPLPGAASDDRWAVVWPVPPTYLHKCDPSGSMDGRTECGKLNLEVFSWSRLLEWSMPIRVVDATKSLPRVELFNPQIFSDADSVVWIHDGEVTARDRYSLGLQIGNVLRKRIKHIDLRWVQPYLHNLKLSPPAVVDKWNVWPVRFEGTIGYWLVVVERDGRTDWLLTEQNVPDEGIARGVLTAQRIARLAGGQPVVVIAEPAAAEPSLMFIPFFVWTPEFFVFSRNAFQNRPNSKNDERRHLVARFGAVKMTEFKINDKRCLAVEFE